MDFDDNPYVTCPYDNTHRVPRSRLQRHLIKCEQHYPKLFICPYNATHRVPFETKIAHCLSCPNRPQDQPAPKARAANLNNPAFREPPQINIEKNLPEDEWD